MALTIIIFLALFIIVALLLFAFSSGDAQVTKQTLSRLDSIKTGPQNPEAENDALDIRRDNQETRPWLDALLQRFEYVPKLRLLLYQAELDWSVEKLLGIALLVAAVCAVAVYLRTGATFLAVFFAGIGAAIPFLYVMRKREKRFLRMKELLPDALDMMVSAIRAGHSFTSAMGMASKESPEPVRREFRQCFDEQNFGLELRTAMLNLVYRVPTREIRMISTAVLIQKETGGNLTEILEKTAHLIRDDFRLQRQVRVHTAQGRLTGWILSLLPVFLGIALYLINPEHMSLLWKTNIGLKLLYSSVIMTSIGVLIIRRIIRIEI